MAAHPISMTLTDDLERNRLTVLVRLILVIPHLIWLSIWGIAVFFAVIISWFATLFAGQTPLGLHNFIAQYLRYGVQVYGYLLFLADPYPGFLGDRPYGADLVVAPPAPQNRWITGFRGILVIPALIVSSLLGYLIEIVADHLVDRLPVHRPHAAGPARPHRLGRPLHRPDARVRQHADRPLPGLLDRPSRVGLRPAGREGSGTAGAARAN